MVYTAIGTGMTMGGPANVLIPLGIEYIPGLSLSQIALYYNWFAIGIIFFLAFISGYRDSRFIAFIMPIWAGVSVFAGWLTFPNPGTGYALLVFMAVLATINYMQEVRHERFGVAGPGNIIIKLWMFMIILQCVVVFTNNAGIFPADTQPIAAGDNQYTNIDLQSNMNAITNSGGLFAKFMDIVSIAAQIAYSVLIMLANALFSIGLFSVVLVQVYPWILTANTLLGVSFLVVLQFAIWMLYVQFWFTLTYRPGPEPGWG